MKELPKLFKIIAEIVIVHRENLFISGYRPGFIFDNQSYTGQRSGIIKLLDRKNMGQGDNGVVEIYFHSDDDIEVNGKFSFYEGAIKKGIGRVIEVIGWVTSPTYTDER